MEALNINTIVYVSYVALICLACLLTGLFGRKMPVLKKIMTICALVFIFIVGLPIADLTIQYFSQVLITQERYIWISENPKAFYIYKTLFSLFYVLILSGIFLQRKSYYEGRLSSVIPIVLLIVTGLNYLLGFMIGSNRYSEMMLPTHIETALSVIALLMIIFILRSSKATNIQNPELGTVLIFLMFIGYVAVLIITYDQGSLQRQNLFYMGNISSILIMKATMLLFVLISGLLLLRYIIYQNPEYFPSHLKSKFTIFNQLSLKTRLLILSGSAMAVIAALTFMLYTPFKDHVKQAWLDDSGSRRNSKTCLSTPVRLEGDLKWTLSIPKIDPIDEKPSYYREEFSHEQKIAQLDALVQAGFLKKIEEDVLIEVNKEQKYVPGFRYRIMPRMTAYSSGGNYPCLTYTDQSQQFLGIDSTTDLMKNYDDQERQTLKKFNITDYVKVSFFVGIEEKNLFPWVKIPEVSKAFNFKHKELRTMKLAKVYGTWIATEDLRVNALRHVTPSEFKQRWDNERQYQQHNRLNALRHTDMSDRANDITIYPHQIESGDFPQKSKVLETFKREYQSGNVGNPFWYHLAAAKVPTDVRAEQGRCESYSPYKVGIITDPKMKRNRQDNIILYSLPYLQDMVKRGILYSYEGQITLKDQSYPGIYFEPTKLYDEAFGLCLNLHEPRFEMLKARSYSSSSLHFDTVAYYERPYWASDEMLENFEELRLMLEYGDTNIARNPAYDLPYIVRKTPIRY